MIMNLDHHWTINGPIWTMRYSPHLASSDYFLSSFEKRRFQSEILFEATTLNEHFQNKSKT